MSSNGWLVFATNDPTASMSVNRDGTYDEPLPVNLSFGRIFHPLQVRFNESVEYISENQKELTSIKSFSTITLRKMAKILPSAGCVLEGLEFLPVAARHPRKRSHSERRPLCQDYTVLWGSHIPSSGSNQSYRRSGTSKLDLRLQVLLKLRKTPSHAYRVWKASWIKPS